MRTIILAQAAARQFDALPREVQRQINTAIERYAFTGEGDVKALTDRNDYRIRVGSYRATFTLEREAIVVYTVAKRDTHTYR